LIEATVRLLRPLVEPLLRLSFAPPHLPEGSSLVRTLKPSATWLSFRYLQVLFGVLGQMIGAGVGAVALVLNLGPWGVPPALLLMAAEVVGIAFALVAVRLDYELRHYLVGDRSLRVSQGAWTRQEATLSYANVQNLEVNQGPLERLFGFKSITVTTAGADATPGDGASMHQVALQGLENADEVRELISGMMKRHRDAGLGEPTRVEAPAPSSALLGEVRDAARALERSATALR
jgi:membrane protein YdbS with pleckstrin-like domain